MRGKKKGIAWCFVGGWGVAILLVVGCVFIVFDKI